MTDTSPIRSPAEQIPTIAKIIWTLGFSIGALSHAVDIASNGWLPYEFMPLLFNVYWTGLVFLDPLAGLLIWVRPVWGLALGCAIMASDVLVNAWTAFIAGYHEFYASLGVQTLFAAFVFFVAIRHRPGAVAKPDTL